MRYAIFSAIGFGLLAGTTRLFVQGVQTRTQILVFCVVGGLWEGWARPRLGHPASGRAFMLTAAAIALAAIAAKYYIECVYIPGRLGGT